VFKVKGMRKCGGFALAGAGTGSTRVLPGFLRRPARLCERLVSGNVEAPRHFGVIFASAFLVSTGLYGMVLGGHTPLVLKETTSRIGFAVGQIKVTGHTETSEIDVLEQLDLDGATSLIGFDSEAARQRVLLMPWVATAQVTKLYPDGVSVEITEKQPFAVWQHDDVLSLVEEKGGEIIAFSDEKYLDLPLVIGEGANIKAHEIVSTISAFPAIAAQVKSYAYIGGRRWDLRLKDGVTLQLPEKNMDAALTAVAQLEKGQALLGRDIEAVDLRIDDRMVVRLTAEAQSVRDATIKELDSKKKKKKEAHI
jgi:cell division protein FtsQ